MKTNQYVYLGIWSETLTSDEISAAVGLEPDAAHGRGTRRSNPPIPTSNFWAVECRDPGLRVDEQVARLLDRLQPHIDSLKRVSADPEVTVGLQLVRRFNEGSGQEQIEGWHLDVPTLQFLSKIAASIDCDEYDMQSHAP